MLVHVKRDELLAIAAQTAKAAPKTATSEAVLGIHVEADSRRSMLTLTATNYEIVIRASMGASVEQSGSVVISAPQVLFLFLVYLHKYTEFACYYVSSE